MAVYFRVLGSRCHYSMCCRCCGIPEIHGFVPKFCGPITYQDNHDRLSKTSTLHYSRLAPKIPRMFLLFNDLSSASCDELCRRYDTYPRAVVSPLYGGQQAIVYRPYRGTLRYQYTGTHSIAVPSNTGCTLKYFAVSASRVLQILLRYSLNSTC